MSERTPGLRSIHRALADPIRIHVLEALWQAHPQSAKELATGLELRPDRLYYHLAQLEKAGLIEIAEYRRLAGGKVERMYQPTTAEPPGDEATPLEVAQFLNAMLEATQVDITSASMAKEDGEQREISLSRTTVRLSDNARATLWEHLQELVRVEQHIDGEDGVWTRVVVTLVDVEDRNQTDR